MAHKRIQFRHVNGGCSVTPPPKVGIRPGDDVSFIVGPRTKLTLGFGAQVCRILTPTPSDSLVLDNSQPGAGNGSAHFNVASNAYQILGLNPEVQIPVNLDVHADCTGGTTGGPAVGDGSVDGSLHDSGDIIMELC